MLQMVLLYVTTVDYNNGALKVFEASGSLGSAVGSGAETLATGETQALALDFTDDFFLATTGQYGSAWILDTGTPANDYDSSPDKVSASLLTYTSPSVKLVRGSDGLFRFNAHNLYLNSTTPANQSITVLSGAPYAVTITGAATMTASGAATGVMSAGTTTFTAATGTLTFGSTSGAGTVHVRRTPSDDTYMQTAALGAVYTAFRMVIGRGVRGCVARALGREPATALNGCANVAVGRPARSSDSRRRGQSNRRIDGERVQRGQRDGIALAFPTHYRHGWRCTHRVRFCQNRGRCPQD
jgi:hypothetical protein